MVVILQYVAIASGFIWIDERLQVASTFLLAMQIDEPLK